MDSILAVMFMNRWINDARVLDVGLDSEGAVDLAYCRGYRRMRLVLSIALGTLLLLPVFAPLPLDERWAYYVTVGSISVMICWSWCDVMCTRIRATEDGRRFRCPWRSAVQLRWEEVVEFRYSYLWQMFVLRGPAGTVRFVGFRNGLGTVAKLAEGKMQSCRGPLRPADLACPFKGGSFHALDPETDLPAKEIDGPPA
ncbi:MAG: hypothetical protein AAF488_07085 [Planctomycetota bacterium]